MTKALFTLKNAGVQRSGRWLVRGVDLELHEGEIVTLIGPNGSGKSTTAKLVLDILKPDEGSLSKRPNLVVSYVPQKLLIEKTLPLSVQRFMSLNAKLHSKDLERALDLTSISHLRNEQMHTLSGGEFQRVQMARAIARNPQLLVLDEPVQGVDFIGEIALYELIKQIRDELNCGILLVSHDLHVVMAATDRVLCLNGHVCCSGTPQSVASTEAYQSLFGDRGSSAIAFYQHQHDHTHLADGRVQHSDGSITDHCHPEDGHHHHKHENEEGAHHHDG